MVKINPVLYDGMVPFCSCYVSTTDQIVGKCPRFSKETKHCELSGTIVGRLCEPAIRRIIRRLVKSTSVLEHLGTGQKPMTNDLYDMIDENRDALGISKKGGYIEQIIEKDLPATIAREILKDC